MARQNTAYNPAQKLFESYLNFSGGLNTEVSNERLAENEFPVFENIDLRGRGSAKRRYGRSEPVKTYPYNTATAKAQGMFTFYRQEQTNPDFIYAISGRLYVQRNGQQTISPLTVKAEDGSDFTFQPDLPIEAVQYRENMFVATGTRFCEINYDSASNTFSAKVVIPYKPTGQEVIFIGTNALASDPSSWVKNTEGSTVSVTSIVPAQVQSSPGQSVRFSAFSEKPANLDLDYTWAYRKTGVGSYNTVKGPSGENFADIAFPDVGKYDVQVTAKGRSYTLRNGNELWTGVASGLRQGLTTGPLDGIDYNKSAVYIESTGTVGSGDSIYYDFPTPFDMSRGNSIEWWWTSYSQTDQNGINPGDVKLLFYTEGNLSNPVVTINNKFASGRAFGGGWVKENSSYNSGVAGIQRVVRIAVRTGLARGTYVPGTVTGISPNNTAFMLDRISLSNSTANSTFSLSGDNAYEVVGVVDPSKTTEAYKAIQTCRTIRLHWDRLILANDNKYPSQLYISDLNNPRYVPTGGRIDFSLDRAEGISGITRYRDNLVVFTKSTTSFLVGTSPDDYRKILVHDQIGCVAPRSVQVVGNDVFFLSNDGIYRLRPNSYTLDMLNVQRVDSKIQTEIHQYISSRNACSIVADGQYWLNIPEANLIYRVYTETGSWVKDTSIDAPTTPLKFSQFFNLGEVVYNLTHNGRVLIHDESVYTDVDDVYIMRVESKMLDQSASFNYKKLKRLHVLAKLYRDRTTDFYVKVLADAQVSLTPEIGKAVVENGEVIWKISNDPNVIMSSGSKMSLSWTLNESLIGDVQIQDHKTSIRGKCKRARVEFVHKEPYLCELYGFGFEFKLKKV